MSIKSLKNRGMRIKSVKVYKIVWGLRLAFKSYL